MPATLRLLNRGGSFDHVGQQSEETCALDGAREFALLECRDRGDAAWHDLAALGNIALQEPHVLVVDLRRIGTGEGARFAPAEERSAGPARSACALGKAHGVIPPSR